MWTTPPAPLVLTAKVWLGQSHSSDEYKSFLNEIRLYGKFDIFLMGGARMGDEIDALRIKLAQLRQIRRAAALLLPRHAPPLARLLHAAKSRKKKKPAPATELEKHGRHGGPHFS
jgi:hypothetical protein